MALRSWQLRKAAQAVGWTSRALRCSAAEGARLNQTKQRLQAALFGAAALGIASASLAEACGPRRRAQCQEAQKAQAQKVPALPRACSAHVGTSDFFDRNVFTDEFWAKVFQRRDLYVQAADCKGSNPLLAGLDEGEVARMFVRAMNDKQGQSPKAFDRSTRRNGKQPFHEYLAGYSLVLDTADRFCPVLAQLSRELGGKHFFHAFCVAYLSPPRCQAFRAHNDAQDVLVAQIWGSKTWHLFEAPVPLIYPEEMVGKMSEVSSELKLVRKVTLSRGDLLYLPRGMVHEARTSDESSLHITITAPTGQNNFGVALTEALRERLSQMSTQSVAGNMLRGAVSQHSMPVPESILGSAVAELSKGLTHADLLEYVRRDSHYRNIDQAFETNRGLLEQGHGCITQSSIVQLSDGVSFNSPSHGQPLVASRGGSEILRLPATPATTKACRSLAEARAGVLMADLPADDVFARLCVGNLLLQAGLLTAEEQAPRKVPDDPRGGWFSNLWGSSRD